MRKFLLQRAFYFGFSNFPQIVWQKPGKSQNLAKTWQGVKYLAASPKTWHMASLQEALKHRGCTTRWIGTRPMENLHDSIKPPVWSPACRHFINTAVDQVIESEVTGDAECPASSTNEQSEKTPARYAADPDQNKNTCFRFSFVLLSGMSTTKRRWINYFYLLPLVCQSFFILMIFNHNPFHENVSLSFTTGLLYREYINKSVTPFPCVKVETT